MLVQLVSCIALENSARYELQARTSQGIATVLILFKSLVIIKTISNSKLDTYHKKTTLRLAESLSA